MVNEVTPAASKLLDQIKRLSDQTNKKGINNLAFEKEAKNARMDNVKNILKGIHSQQGEKIEKKSEIFSQTFKNVTQGDKARDIPTMEMLDPVNLEKRRRREPVGSFLDIYV